MDSRKIIKKYIMPGGFTRYGGIVFGLLLAVTLVMGIVTLNTDVGDPVEFYPSDTPTGTMAYIDVVGVSSWLYQYDDATYYTVEDAEGYFYTVRLTNSQFNQMAAQQTYWNRESDATPAPAAYHLVGYVQTATDSIRQSLAQSWGISSLEYTQYFGENYLNATTSVAAENSAGWFVGAMFTGFFALLCLILTLRAGSVAKKCLRSLEERGLLDWAAQQLSNPTGHTVIGKNRGILTQDFIFGRGTGAVVHYNDVIWAYKQEQQRNFMVVSSYLMVGTAYMNPQGIIDVNGGDRHGYIGTALAVINQRNPYALLGFTNENRMAYKATVKGGQ